MGDWTMNVITLIIILSFQSIHAAPGKVIVHNGTDEIIVFAFLKTARAANVERYEYMYKEPGWKIQIDWLFPGMSVALKGYEVSLLFKYDRTLWVANIQYLGSFKGLGEAPFKPEMAIPLEVGGKTNVVIVSAGEGNYTLKPWTSALGKDLETRRSAMYEALRATGLTWGMDKKIKRKTDERDILNSANEAKLLASQDDFKKIYNRMKRGINQ